MDLLQKRLDRLSELKNSYSKEKPPKRIQSIIELVNELVSRGLTQEKSEVIFPYLDQMIEKAEENRSLMITTPNVKNKITSFARKDMDLYPKNYYQGTYMAIGMSVGIAFGIAAFGTEQMALGMIIGLSAGLAIGAGKDKKIKKAGKQLSISN